MKVRENQAVIVKITQVIVDSSPYYVFLYRIISHCLASVDVHRTQLSGSAFHFAFTFNHI